MAEFEVFVSKADFKFNCAHFIIFDGFRERLHGHNYQLSVKVIGSDTIGLDGYVLDFGDIKKVTRLLCKEINEYFICPARSPNMSITEKDGEICLVCDDGSKFSFPKTDVAMLPLLHSSAEELSHYFWCGIIRSFKQKLVDMMFTKANLLPNAPLYRRIGLQKLIGRGINCIEVSVAEAPNQSATYRCRIPESEEKLTQIETSPLNVAPKPCLEYS